MDDLKVRIVYKDRELQPVYEQVYTLKDYTDMLRLDLMRIISDVEDLVYLATGDKPKEAWGDETWTAFHRIRHKILDKAGAVGRLPDDLSEGRKWQDRNG